MTEAPALKTYCLAFSLLIIFGITGIVVTTTVWALGRDIVYEYGVMMDGGSTHTSVYVYEWNAEKNQNMAVPSQIGTRTHNRSISSFNGDLQGLESLLRGLLNYSVKIIPEDKHKDSLVYFGATGGMRNLRAKNRTASEEILQVIRETTSKYPFHFSNNKTQVRILSGVEEALFSWTTSNYVAGDLQAKPEQSSNHKLNFSKNTAGDSTIGALDLGGTSTQIAFHPDNSIIIPQNYNRNIKLYGLVNDLYSNSYNCYGVVEVFRMYKALLVTNQNYKSYIMSPCGHIGYTFNQSYSEIFEAPCTKNVSSKQNHDLLKDKIFTFKGSGDIKQCQVMVQHLFDFMDCNYSHCGFNGQYQPPLYGQYYAFSNFYLEMEFLRDNLHLKFTNFKTNLKDFTQSVELLCHKNWTEVKTMKTAFQGALPLYCFGGQYIHTLLTQGFKFNESTWNNISFVNKINEIDVGWALGYMLEASVGEPRILPVTVLSNTTFAGFIAAFLVIVIIPVGIIGVFIARKYKKKNDGLIGKEYLSYGTAEKA